MNENYLPNNCRWQSHPDENADMQYFSFVKLKVFALLLETIRYSVSKKLSINHQKKDFLSPYNLKISYRPFGPPDLRYTIKVPGHYLSKEGSSLKLNVLTF